jgi:hypothetical protein
MRHRRQDLIRYLEALSCKGYTIKKARFYEFSGSVNIWFKEKNAYCW